MARKPKIGNTAAKARKRQRAYSTAAKPKGGSKKPKVGNKMMQAMYKKAPGLRGTSGKSKSLGGGVMKAGKY
jgi:hypothetical protein